MNLELARANMIEQQIRTWEVLDPRVLQVMAEVPRERFVPERFRNLAFADIQVPIGHDQVMMAPKVEGRLLQALAVRPGDRILEVGTGSGYVTALLARLGSEVWSVDIHADFVRDAGKQLAALGVKNVRLAAGDAVAGWPAQPQYDVIAITGSVLELPARFREQLAPGGRLFVIEGAAPVMEARLVTRVTDVDFAVEGLFETELPPLVGVKPPSRFRF
ncbi:MAG: protein-L-isoaspartate O-methyltransferase [Gammaproteobacteria bacterium]